MDDQDEKVTDELLESVRRDLARSAWWGRVHAGFLTLVAFLVGAGWVGFLLVREWVIWR